MKKFFRRILSSVLVVAFSVCCLWGSGFSVAPLVSQAEDFVLEDGLYVAPLLRNKSDSTVGTYSRYNFYLSRACLEVKNGKQSLTIGVENWSQYDNFAILKQENTSEYLEKGYSLADFPSSFFETDLTYTYDENNQPIKSSEMAKTEFEKSKKVADQECDAYFQYNLDIQTNEADIAYITFDINDYNDRIYVYNWFNVYTTGSKFKNLYSSCIIWLDTNNIEKIDVDNDKLGYAADSLNVSHAIQSFTPLESINCILFDGNVSCDVSKSENGYSAKYYLADNNSSESYFIISNKVKNVWDVLSGNSFKELALNIDEKGKYFTIDYPDIKQFLLGTIIRFNNKYVPGTGEGIFNCSLGITKSPCEYCELSSTDDEKNITFTAIVNKKYIDEGYKLEVKEDIDFKEKNYSNYYYDPSLCNSYKAYFTLNNETVSIGLCRFIISLPENFDTNAKWNAEYVSNIGDKAIITNDAGSMYQSESNKWIFGSRKIENYTFSILKYVDRIDMEGENLPDGIYSSEIVFYKTGQFGQVSMSDEALIDKAYLVRKNGINTLYFKSQGMYVDAAKYGEEYGSNYYCYIGELYCVDKTKIPDYNSVKYTDWELNDDNTNLRDNIIYNGVSEFGCLKGGILTLNSTSYDEVSDVYLLGIEAPAMEAIANSSYENAKKATNSGAGLTVWLSFEDLEPCASNVTLDTILNEGYGYQPSALLRRIKQAELYDGNKYSTESFASLTSVIKTAQGVYEQSFDDAASASHAYEAQITALDEAIANLKEPEVTVSGYQASVADNVTLNYVLNIPEALEDKADSGKLMATITYADGTTKEIAVQAEDEYFVPVSVAPKEIANEISVTIGDGTFTYSVKEYLESVVNSETATDSKKAVAKSLLNYAGCAQDYFKAKNADANAYLSDTKANENVDSTLADITDDAVKAFDAPALGDNVSFYGASLTCDYDTSIKMYFKVTDDIANHTFTANGETVEAVEAADGIYSITYSGISAKNLATAYPFSVDGTSFTYGAYNYIYAALNATEVQSGALTELQNMVKAIYYYAEAAKLA